MSKFKTGDKVYLDKRGILGIDYTMIPPILIKNKKYIIHSVYNNQIRLFDNYWSYDENLFKKFEQ